MSSGLCYLSAAFEKVRYAAGFPTPSRASASASSNCNHMLHNPADDDDDDDSGSSYDDEPGEEGAQDEVASFGNMIGQVDDESAVVGPVEDSMAVPSSNTAAPTTGIMTASLVRENARLIYDEDGVVVRVEFGDESVVERPATLVAQETAGSNLSFESSMRLWNFMVMQTEELQSMRDTMNEVARLCGGNASEGATARLQAYSPCGVAPEHDGRSEAHPSTCLSRGGLLADVQISVLSYLRDDKGRLFVPHSTVPGLRPATRLITKGKFPHVMEKGDGVDGVNYYVEVNKKVGIAACLHLKGRSFVTHRVTESAIIDAYCEKNPLAERPETLDFKMDLVFADQYASSESATVVGVGENNHFKMEIVDDEDNESQCFFFPSEATAPERYCKPMKDGAVKFDLCVRPKVTSNNLKVDKKRAFAFRVRCTTPGFENVKGLCGTSRAVRIVSKYRRARNQGLNKGEAYVTNPVQGGEPIKLPTSARPEKRARVA